MHTCGARITKMCDSLNGQKLNDGKSVVWGTNTAARNAVQQPEMTLAHTFEALGVKIYTSQKDDCQFSEAPPKVLPYR